MALGWGLRFCIPNELPGGCQGCWSRGYTVSSEVAKKRKSPRHLVQMRKPRLSLSRCWRSPGSTVLLFSLHVTSEPQRTTSVPPVRLPWESLFCPPHPTEGPAQGEAATHRSIDLSVKQVPERVSLNLKPVPLNKKGCKLSQ